MAANYWCWERRARRRLYNAIIIKREQKSTVTTSIRNLLKVADNSERITRK